MLAVVENPTSIDVYWKPISDAIGYVVYVDNAVYDIIKNTTITIDELIPERVYVIAIRAYQDILGPSSTIYASTNNGKNFVVKHDMTLLYFHIATTEVTITLISPISLMTLKTGLIYGLQCQTDAEPDSLTFSIGSTVYNATQQLMENLTYIRELTVTEFTGADIIVHCNWSINDASFTGSAVIEGKFVCIYLSIYTSIK